MKFQEPTEDPNMNVLLYGPPKSGKTVAAMSSPGPILYLNSDTPNATRFGHFLFDDKKVDEVHVENLDTLTEVAVLLDDKPDEYATVVLDPVGETFRHILEGLNNKAVNPEIQEYGDAGTYLERFLRHLCAAPVNAIFVAHEFSERDEQRGEIERLPYSTTKSGSSAFSNKLMAMVDVIAYTGVVDDEEGTRYLATLVNARGRRGGDRFGALGPSREMNLTEWADLARATATSVAD